MEENVQKEDGFSLFELFHLLFSKIKLLLLVAVVFAFIGATFAVLTTSDIRYYGTQKSVDFYINPVLAEDTNNNSDSQYGVYGAYSVNVMNNIVLLLESDSFAERLMLDSNWIPSKNDRFPAEINQKIDSVNALFQANPNSAEFKTSLEELLKAWRALDGYTETLELYSSSVSYDFLAEGADVEDVQNLARSFIYVNISVLNSKSFAEHLLARITEELPEYVIEKMPIPTGYSGTSCIESSRVSNIIQTNEGYTTSQALIYAVILAIAAVAVTCIVIILIDKSDKRLRDYETTMRQLNVPVLGVIPTIAPISANDKNGGSK